MPPDQSWIKPAVLALYACFGVALLWLARGRKLPALAFPRRVLIIGAGALAFVILLRFSLHGVFFAASVAVVTVGFAIESRTLRSPGRLAAIFIVVTASLSLAWWLASPGHPFDSPHGWPRVVAFLILATLFWFGLTRRGGSVRRWQHALLFTVFFVASVILLSDLSPFHHGTDALALMAHHHGAYIGSALHLLAGLVPFYDVPLQYGLGPTLLIASACKVAGCWPGLRFLTVASSALMGLLILFMALAGFRSRSLLTNATASAIVFASVFLWPGMLNLGSVLTAVPSIGGMRFLPVTVVAFCLYFNRPRAAALALVPAVLWSPELAVMSVTVFGVCETARLGLVSAARNTFGILAASFLAMALLHHAIYGVWIQPDVMAEYILHVPGPLPVNPLSDFLLLVLALALSAWAAQRRQAGSGSLMQDLVAASLLFAATSYYLGRSDPNNICNLMPFIALVGLRTVASQPADSAIGKLSVIGLATSAAAVAFSFWTFVPFGPTGTQHEVLSAAMATLDPDINEMRARIANPEHLGIADLGDRLNRNPAETTVWTPMDPGSLWTYVPSERRKLYIARSAARLKKPGWVVVQENQKALLDDFEAAYSVSLKTTSQLHGSNFVVAYLEPRMSTAPLVANRKPAGAVKSDMMPLACRTSPASPLCSSSF